jgi:hypothetical protein
MTYGKWLSLSLDTRNKIAEIFGIIRKGQIEVFSNTVKNDGYLVQDIEAALTPRAIKNYLRVDEDNPEILVEFLIKKVEAPVIPVITATPMPEPVIATGTFDGKIEKMSDVKPEKITKVAKVIKTPLKSKVVKKVAKKNAKK